MRQSLDEYYLQILDLVAERSTCARRAVGAIITDELGHVLSTGYNGVPSGFDHCTEFACPGVADSKGDTSRCLAVHAEQNALLQCHDLDKARVMYVSATPCFTCSKMIANTNIRRIVCLEEYTDKTGLAVLWTKNIKVVVPTR